ncbi:MAG: hypothetical protein AAFV53_15470 [Myxococcota bacterium]
MESQDAPTLRQQVVDYFVMSIIQIEGGYQCFIDEASWNAAVELAESVELRTDDLLPDILVKSPPALVIQPLILLEWFSSEVWRDAICWWALDCTVRRMRASCDGDVRAFWSVLSVMWGYQCQLVTDKSLKMTRDVLPTLHQAPYQAGVISAVAAAVGAREPWFAATAASATTAAAIRDGGLEEMARQHLRLVRMLRGLPDMRQYTLMVS